MYLDARTLVCACPCVDVYMCVRVRARMHVLMCCVCACFRVLCVPIDVMYVGGMCAFMCVGLCMFRHPYMYVRLSISL